MSNLIEYLRKQNVAVYMLGIAFFFCVVRYNGIVTDSMLYTLQAVHYLHPERFVGDIAFMYGNQDSFTIISPIYALVLEFFSVEMGAKIICIVSHLFFCYCIYNVVGCMDKKVPLQ